MLTASPSLILNPLTAGSCFRLKINWPAYSSADTVLSLLFSWKEALSTMAEISLPGYCGLACADATPAPKVAKTVLAKRANKAKLTTIRSRVIDIYDFLNYMDIIQIRL